MYERLILFKELLAEGGAIWIHCDWHKNHFCGACWMKFLVPTASERK